MDVLSERLIDLRIEHGYNQDDVAAELNVSSSGYGYYEQGRNEPSLETIYKIACFYQVSVDYLLGKIDTPNHPVNYAISDNLSLTASEIKTVKRMKELSLLDEISENPNVNIERLDRFWKFIKKELDK